MSTCGSNVTQTQGKLQLLDLQEQTVETIRRKKVRGMADQEQYRLCSKVKEIFEHLLANITLMYLKQ